MLIENPVYENYKQIRERYDGYCVFIARYKGASVEPEGGEVLAYNNSLAKLIKEVRPLRRKENIGEHTFLTFTDFGDSSVIQVVPYND